MKPSHQVVGHIVLGLLAFLTSQWLGMVNKIEPFHTYLYLFSWWPFIWVLDRILVLRTRKSPIFGSPSRWKLTKEFKFMMMVSVTLWLFFEIMNFRLQNWCYIGIPRPIWIRWPGYILSFATVLPGLLFVKMVLELYLSKWIPSDPTDDDNPKIIGGLWSPVVGFIMIQAPLIWPKYLFPLVWGAFLFFLEPRVQKCKGHSLFQDWENNNWLVTISLLISGAICGLFWEACNFGAGAKWVYNIPFVGFFKIFEMPILGFLGFPVFALSAFIMYERGRLLWKKLNSKQRKWVRTIVVIFWLATFYGIDQMTVLMWR
jgi:hypothetical protein